MTRLLNVARALDEMVDLGARDFEWLVARRLLEVATARGIVIEAHGDSPANAKSPSKWRLSTSRLHLGWRGGPGLHQRGKREQGIDRGRRVDCQYRRRNLPGESVTQTDVRSRHGACEMPKPVIPWPEIQSSRMNGSWPGPDSGFSASGP